MSINNLNCKLFHNFHLNLCYFIFFHYYLLLLCVWLPWTNKIWKKNNKKRKIGKCQVWKAKLWNIILNWESCLCLYVLYNIQHFFVFAPTLFVLMFISLSNILLKHLSNYLLFCILCTYFWFYSFVWEIANKKRFQKKRKFILKFFVCKVLLVNFFAQDIYNMFEAVFLFLLLD